MTLIINNWSKHYEKSDHKKCKEMKWVAVPVDFSNKGYKKLMRRKDGSEIFGAWIVLLELASKDPHRGELRDSDGDYSYEDMELITECPLKTLKKTISVLCQETFGWLRETSGCLPDDIPTTLHNKTGQDITEQDTIDSTYQAFFEEFWKEYPERNGKKVGKKLAFEAFKKISIPLLTTVIANAKNYGINNDLPKDPERFLKNDFWMDWDTPQEPKKGNNSYDGSTWTTN